MRIRRSVAEVLAEHVTWKWKDRRYDVVGGTGMKDAVEKMEQFAKQVTPKLRRVK